LNTGFCSFLFFFFFSPSLSPPPPFFLTFGCGQRARRVFGSSCRPWTDFTRGQSFRLFFFFPFPLLSSSSLVPLLAPLPSFSSLGRAKSHRVAPFPFFFPLLFPFFHQPRPHAIRSGIGFACTLGQGKGFFFPPSLPLPLFFFCVEREDRQGFFFPFPPSSPFPPFLTGRLGSGFS